MIDPQRINQQHNPGSQLVILKEGQPLTVKQREQVEKKEITIWREHPVIEDWEPINRRRPSTRALRPHKRPAAHSTP